MLFFETTGDLLVGFSTLRLSPHYSSSIQNCNGGGNRCCFTPTVHQSGPSNTPDEKTGGSRMNLTEWPFSDPTADLCPIATNL